MGYGLVALLDIWERWRKEHYTMDKTCRLKLEKGEPKLGVAKLFGVSTTSTLSTWKKNKQKKIQKLLKKAFLRSKD